MFFKKYLIIIFFLNFCNCAAFANDIRDFQINGISLGDNLLNFYNRELIQQKLKNKETYYYKNNKYADLILSPLKKDELYDYLQITISPKNDDFSIKSIAGQIFFINKMHECQEKKKEIISDLKNLFPGKNFFDDFHSHPLDKSGMSKVDQSILELTDGLIRVECYDWSNKYPYQDKLIVAIGSNEFNNFLRDEAY